MEISLLDVSKNHFFQRKETTFTLSVSSLSFRVGAIHVLRGKSGCGKTTLLGLIALLDDPDEGVRKIDGETIGPKERKDLRKSDGLRSRFFYLPAEPIIAPGLTVKELYRAYGFADIREDFLSRLGLDGYGERVVQSLSRGEQARVLIALACQSDADALILDEPAGNLNEENKARVYSLLREEAAKRLVVIASHDYDVERDGCCHMILMENGRIIEDRGDPGLASKDSSGELAKHARKPALAPLVKATKFALRNTRLRVYLLAALSLLAGAISSFTLNLSFYDPGAALLDSIKAERHQFVGASLGMGSSLSDDALAQVSISVPDHGSIAFFYGREDTIHIYGRDFEPEDGVAYVPSCYAQNLPSPLELNGIPLEISPIEGDWDYSNSYYLPAIVSAGTGAELALSRQVRLYGERAEEVAETLISCSNLVVLRDSVFLASSAPELRALAVGEGRGFYIVYNEAVNQAPEDGSAIAEVLKKTSPSSGPSDIPSGPIEFLGFLSVGNLCQTGYGLLPTDSLYEELKENAFFSGSFFRNPVEYYAIDRVAASWLMAHCGNLEYPTPSDFPQISILQGIATYALPALWAASFLLFLVMVFVASLVMKIVHAAVGPLSLRLRISGLPLRHSSLALLVPFLFAFLLPAFLGALVSPVLLPIKDLMVMSFFPTFYAAFPFSWGGYFFSLLPPVLCVFLIFLSLVHRDRKPLVQELRRSED